MFLWVRWHILLVRWITWASAWLTFVEANSQGQGLLVLSSQVFHKIHKN